MTRIDALVEALQRAARDGDRAVQLGLALAHGAGEEFEPMTFIATFRKAFGVPIQVLHESVSWVGFGFGDVDDEEFGARINPYVEAWRKENV